VRGGTGADIFVFDVSNPQIRVLDFDPEVDRIALPDGVSYESLVITSTYLSAANGYSVDVRFTDADGFTSRMSLRNPDEFFTSNDINRDNFILLSDDGTVDPEPPIGDGVLPDSYDEVLIGTSGKDVLIGTDGNDLIRAAGGSDRVDGGAGEDVIAAGRGPDYNIAGGADADIFLFNVNSSQLRIVDFEDGLDTIGLIGGITFDDLEIREFSAGVTIEYINDDGNAARVTLRNTDEQDFTAADITADDFISVSDAEIDEILLLT
jgi:Ca2+-binding RTX toxin-like protein